MHLSNTNWDISADFEQAERKVFLKIFHNCAVHGCVFHYCQALKKNIAQYGLLKPYKNKPNFRYFIRKYMMLMMVPSDMVQEAWNELKTQVKKTFQKKYLSQFMDWLLHHDNTWMDKRYIIEDWSRWGNETGTNNLAGILNAKLVAMLSKHPTITEWIIGVQKHFAVTIARWEQLNKHGKTNWRSNKDVIHILSNAVLIMKSFR